MLGRTFSKAAMEAFLATPFSRFYFRYRYMFTPTQLFELCELALEASTAKGHFYEIGAAYGDTTVFINKFLNEKGVWPDYTVVDTFEGFTENDLAHEFNERGINREIRKIFSVNDPGWMRRKLRTNGVRANVIQSDARKVAFQTPIAFALLDIDLYLPTRDLLPVLYAHLSRGGIIVIDDCKAIDPRWNGAHQAYIEFINENKLANDVRAGKLGIVRR